MSAMNELFQFLDDLTQATHGGRAKWARLNPTTFTYSPPNNPGRIMLQRIQGPQRVQRGNVMQMVNMTTHILQAFDAPQQSTPRFAINGTENDQINQKLSVLYDNVASGLTQGDVAFLQSLLPPK
jgi:hypothetical protein